MKKKIIIILSAILFALSMSFLTYKVHADSGWDSDYDSGSSWDSGTSWDSGSSWSSSSWESSDHSYSYSSGSRRSSNGSSGFAAFVVFIIIVFLIILLSSTGRSKAIRTTSVYSRKIQPINDEEIKKILPEFNTQEFLSKAYDIFINVQNAWMEFDYDSLRKYLSDELFNTYKSQLKALSLQKQKNIMNSFDKLDIGITNFNYNDNKYTITVELIASFYDYVVNNENAVVRGNNNRKITNHYELTFISSISKKNKSNKCPNCNAPLDNYSSNVCPYCKSTIVSEHYDWIMSKKQIKR